MSNVIKHSSLLARTAEQLGASEAWMTIEGDYEGKCTVYTTSGDQVATLPSVREACRVARYAITPDGGYGDVVICANPEAEVSHESWYEWAFAESPGRD